jgi:hypothetical protein
LTAGAAMLLLAVLPSVSAAQAALGRSAASAPPRAADGSPRAAEAQKFLARRGWRPGRRKRQPNGAATVALGTAGQGNAAPTWTPLGPAAVQTQHFGLVTGRISSLALDPADPSGNLLYVGTTGGGVWKAQNAASSSPVFIPLTDAVSALGGAWDASISIGALTVQPGGTGVILAGTGDPNDALDSYYGTGILRSTDNGTTWSLIRRTVDVESGLSSQNYLFGGEGFAGFAWSTADPERVVAAVSQAYEGGMVNAVGPYGSLQGLYYSTDSGEHWHLARITDGGGADVQGPLDAFPRPDGNAATAVVWNSKRGVFIAAVRYHGYYQSPDGITWTRLDAQPGMNANSGTGLTTKNCPTNTGRTGSIACPIFRGALAVDRVTGDTYAWTVDANKQDQGLWRDACSFANGACAAPQIAFAEQWDTAALETNTLAGPATIVDGDYNLTLAVVPVGQAANPVQQDVRVLAGAHDLWETACPVSLGCTWRNTTNATTCMSAQVGEFQHALAWNQNNPLEVFLGNDSGLWRSLDGIGEGSGDPVCSSSDASHFQNLNGQFQNRDGSMGSLAEVTSVSPILDSPYTIMAGLGVNGTAGVKNTAATADWPQMLGGYGGPVAIPSGDENSWYVNGQAGVAIYRCAQSSACTPADFGASPVVSDADVGGDGYVMPVPAAFVVDPLDPAQLLIATCRVWRGSGGSAMHAVTTIADNASALGPCQGDALIRSIAAMAISPTSEVVYAGMYGGTSLPGHVLMATIDTSSTAMPAWQDLTAKTVTNDSARFNAQGLDISSIVFDPRDASGRTVYVTVQGIGEFGAPVQTVYRTVAAADGSIAWNALTSNLPNTPVSALVLDPQNANIAYVATDDGVYYTTEISACANAPSNCWSPFGSGLPAAPVVALSAASGSASDPVLVAGTYGRGIWQTALWTAESGLGAATANPDSLTFSSQISGTTSSPQTVTLINTGSIPVAFGAISKSGDGDDFAATGCTGQSVPPGSTCNLQVSFAPQATGPRSAVMMIAANVYGGQLALDLNGDGLPGGSIDVSPGSLSFNTIKVGSASAPQAVTLTNAGTSPVSIAGAAATAPFSIVSNTCNPGTLAPGGCQIRVAFTPATAGPATGLLSVSDSEGTQTVELSGTGAAPPTDILTPTALDFPSTPSGQISSAQSVTISNTGDLPLHVTAITASANFQQSSDCLGGVAAQSSCGISVQFVPAQAGALTGTLSITDDLGTRTVALSGTGLQPGMLTVTPASLSFPQQQPGVASAPQSVTITNSGSETAAGLDLQITGPAAGNYSLGAGTCGAQLNGGSSCTAQVVFKPAAAGPIAAVLNISSSTPGVMAVQVPLNGSGQLATGLSATPAQLSFTPAVGMGLASSAQTVTITNSSSLAITGLTLKATAPFAVAQSSCTGSLGPGASCSADIVFAPSATGAATGTFMASSSEVSTPATVALSGTGFDFTVAPLGPASAAVSSGQQADFKLLITPKGAGGSFSFQCGSLPSYASCLFSPATEDLDANVQGNAGVQIYTGNSNLTAGVHPLSASPHWPMLCALFVLPLALFRRRKISLLVLLTVLLSAGISSCAGAMGGTGDTGPSSGQSGTKTTPAGTYSIPVTVTSTGISRSTTLTLTVD